MKTFWVIVLGGLVASCAGANEDQLRTRAAFDFKCDAGSIQITELDDRTRGAEGCGQQGTYVESCDGPKAAATTSCTWVLNSDSRKSP